ncbi:MAG: VanZ family protein [Romboutsia sp.]|uniref:VanZ family protein n=1 Tax=Romboutsia sp. TaxID=1965302 RepID=UPI003F2B21A2
MNKKRMFFIGVIVWMGMIFLMSNQPANLSLKLSGSVIDILSNTPIVGNILSGILESSSAQFIVRKCGHMLLFGTLSTLSFMVIYELKKCRYKATWMSFVFTFLYACGDEFHQLFIPGRSGQVRDVFIDCIGSVLGLILVNFMILVMKKYKVDA